MTLRKRGFRALVLGALAAAWLALAPSAFAHGGIGIGINLPGLSIGVGPHHHGYIGIGGGYYSPRYAPAYYAPAPVYYDYDDDYYSAPVYVGGYYGGYYGSHRYYHRGGYYGGYHGGGYHHDYHHGGYHDGGHSHGGYHHH